MNHLVLIGDSIFDNRSYTDGGPAVIDHVQALLPGEWKASLFAIDGSTTLDMPAQIASVPDDATHLVLSIGGNDALLRAEILDSPVSCSGEALLMLAEMAATFEVAYRKTIADCLELKLPLTICTIYHGNFPEPSYQRRVGVALTVFNDVIIRIATERRLKVIDLRLICTSSSDYANPIEPSVLGGGKIGLAIVRAVTEPVLDSRGAQVLAA